MYKIIYIKEKTKNLLLLGISEEGESARYTVDEALYTGIGSPPRGAELSESQLAEIIYTDEYYRAKKKALSLLSLADNNERTLKVKLLRAGIRREIADSVVAEMVGLGYINEARQLERLILAEANERLRGPYKIMPKLAGRGYRGEDIRRAMSALIDSGDIDFEKNGERLLEKMLGTSSVSEEAERILYKHGYKKC